MESPADIAVACVLKAGGPYMPEYVARLKAGVDAHLAGHRFICLSDIDVPCERLPLINNWPGWWSKLELFRLTGPVLYFDLDTVITGDLTAIASHPHKFTMLRDFSKGGPASGIMAWHGDYRHLMESFDIEQIDNYPGHGDQGYIGWRLGSVDYFQNLFPGQIVSRKQPQYRNANERVVCFHGKPRPHEVNWSI